MGDHSDLSKDIRQGLLQFEARVERRFEQVEARLTGLDQKMEGRPLRAAAATDRTPPPAASHHGKPVNEWDQNINNPLLTSSHRRR
jgi:hypothetical protein